MKSISRELGTWWSRNDPNPVTAQYVKNLIDLVDEQNDQALSELNALFPDTNQRISFGTAGLRAAMAPGPLNMNDLTVVQTAQGLARYCLANHDKSSGKPCIVVGYDHRNNPSLQISSLSFAILSSLVFAEAGIECLLLDGFVLTPLVPFVLQKVKAVAGIMVTASHNPKLDDGYKVYASDGCQIRAPMDKEISAEIMKNLDPWTDYSQIIQARKQKFTDPCLGLSKVDTTREMIDAYFAALVSSGLKTGQADKVTQMSSMELLPPRFAYTAMHGVGYPFAKRVFETFGLPMFQAVPSQMDPDFEFPTVPFPNPEEKGALDLAKEFATENQCDIVLANDPDADRLAVAERDRSTGEWTVFCGDEIGVMLGAWLWQTMGKSSEKPVSMCASTVSSKMLAEIARVEGFHFEDTLTGFKWIGSRSAELSRSGYHHVFGYEEAIGFACGDVIFDKDGVSAMAVFAEMALSVYHEGKSLKKHMQSLYDKYGEFVSYNGYFVIQDFSVIETIMKRIRDNGNYGVDLTPYAVVYIRDLDGTGYDSSKADKKPTLPPTPLITIGFTNGCVVQLRPSGTEPKFKYYIEMKGQPGQPREEVVAKLEAMAPYVLEKLLEPEKNGLKRP